MMCTSFWVGLLSVILLKFSPTVNLLILDENPTNLQFIFGVLFDAFSVVAFVWFTYIIQTFFEDRLKTEL
jgi:hypothetical protein